MRGFEVTERVRCGIKIFRDGSEPHIAKPLGCTRDIRLHPQLLDYIAGLRSKTAKLRLADSPYKQITLSPVANDLILLSPYSGHRDNMALVHLCTAGGVGGKAYLTANVLEETQNERGEVSKRISAFPSLGVQAFCSDEELERLRAGVDMVDVLLQMRKGSNFCVRRTGELEGAQAVLTIKWTGSLLLIDGQPIPQRRSSDRSEPRLRAAPAQEPLPASEYPQESA
jgi:hypothetical protein